MLRKSIFSAVFYILYFMQPNLGCFKEAKRPEELKMSDRVWNILEKPKYLSRIFPARASFFRWKPHNAVDFDIPVENGIHVGARWYNADSTNIDLLYFHGNGEIIPDYNSIADIYSAAGLNLFVVDYRGYGWSGGSPSIRKLKEDSFKIATFFFEKTKGRKMPFIMGRSIGSGPACELAAAYPNQFAGLILESGYSDPVPLFQLLQIDMKNEEESIRQVLSNARHLQKIKIPVLFIHGSEDTLIPSSHANENFASLPHLNKFLKIIHGAGHNNLLNFEREYFSSLQSFVKQANNSSNH